MASRKAGSTGKVHTVGWNNDGRRIAAGAMDSLVRVWRVDSTGRADAPLLLKGHGAPVDQLGWDPTRSDRLATASQDRTVRLWDTKSGKCVATVQTPGENINLAWRPDGHYIAVGDKQDRVSIIDTRSLKVDHSNTFSFEANEVRWDATGELLYLATGRGTVQVLSFATLQSVYTVPAHTSNCFCLGVDPRGRYFAVGSGDALVSVWDVNELACVRTYGKLEVAVRTLGFSFDGQFIAASGEELVDIYNVETGELAERIECLGMVNAVSWHPSKYVIAMGLDVNGNNVRLHGSWD